MKISPADIGPHPVYCASSNPRARPDRFAPSDQSRVVQLVQMEVSADRQHAELLGDDARRQPGGTTGHKEPEQFEPGFLGQSAERGDNAFWSIERHKTFMF